MDRRSFLKACAALGAGLALPVPQAMRTVKHWLGYVSVAWFGAKTDGTDCTDAFQAAIDYAIEHNIKEVRIPAGTYRVNALDGKNTMIRHN